MEASVATPFATDGLARIKNPLSEKFAVLRPSIVPGLIESLNYNLNRQAAGVRLFEVGSVFSPRDEHSAVGWVLTGSRGEHWSGSAGSFGFADTNGIAQLLAGAAGLSLRIEPADDLTWLAAGERAALAGPDGRVGWIGRLAARRSDEDAIYAGELDVAALIAARTAGRDVIRPLPRHPMMTRDLSIIVDRVLPAAEVRGTIRAHAPETLVAVEEFDRYQGKGVPEHRVSLSIRLTFRAPDRTLTDAEVQAAVERVVAALVETHGAVLRGA
jgi:phenylalanyl-tRNA synthetase beta chain